MIIPVHFSGVCIKSIPTDNFRVSLGLSFADFYKKKFLTK